MRYQGFRGTVGAESCAVVVTVDANAAGRRGGLVELSRLFAEAAADVDAVTDSLACHLAEHVGDVCVVRLLSADGLWLEPGAVRRRTAAGGGPGGAGALPRAARQRTLHALPTTFTPRLWHSRCD